MYQAGLILEGGGMRGVYTAGVLDAFMEKEVSFSSVYGVSAGSCHACSYLAGQYGRAYRINVDYLDDPAYCGVKSLLKTGNFFGADMLYSKIPDVLDPFDHEAFYQYKGKFYAVVSNVDTGEPEYIRIKDLKKQMWAIRASSSLPLISKTIVVNGRSYLDGGITDSIPIERSIKDGNHKNVVILTRGKGYRKEASPAMSRMMKLRYPGKKAFVAKSDNRYLRYNETIDFLEREEAAGRVFLIRPEHQVEVGRLEKDKTKLEALYQIGLDDGRKHMENMLEYLDK